MKNLEQKAQKVWVAATVEQKKQALNEMIDSFDHPKKADKFRRMVVAEGRSHKLDFLASNIMLADTDAVIG